MQESDNLNGTTISGSAPPHPGEDAPRAKLICISEQPEEDLTGCKIQLIDDEVTVGRDADNSVCIEHKKISRHHVRIFIEGAAWTIEDLGSTNGTWVNEMRITRASLHDGDAVKIGAVPFRFVVLASLPRQVAVQSAHPSAEGTVYAGHPAVASVLSAVSEPDGRVASLGALPDRPSPSTARPPGKSGVRIALGTGIIVALLAAIYFVDLQFKRESVNHILREYEASIDKTISPGQRYRIRSADPAELAVLEAVSAKLDKSLADYPREPGLRDLKARVLFLIFERNFDALLAKRQFVQAERLVESTRKHLDAIAADTGTYPGVDATKGLIELASIVVKFRELRQRFTSAKTVKEFSDAERQTLGELKQTFIRQKKRHHMLLAVSYPLLHWIVMGVDEHDLPLVNGWISSDVTTRKHTPRPEGDRVTSDAWTADDAPSRPTLGLKSNTDAEANSSSRDRSSISVELPASALGNYYALVFGSNDYARLPKLDTAVSDAKAIAALLKKKYGFDTTTVLNANRYAIISTLSRFRERLTVNDNLLIYYAGHGELDKINQRGHWLPIDAELNNTANWISNIDVTDILNAMSARHILVVADSCYSGALTRASRADLRAGMSSEARVNWVRTLAKKRSRTALTSGGLAPVMDTGTGDHSVFAKALLEVLEENNDFMEGARLYQEVATRVAFAATRFEVEQVPDYAPIKYAGHDTGDFIFAPVDLLR